jgi:hypothetical protein
MDQNHPKRNVLGGLPTPFRGRALIASTVTDSPDDNDRFGIRLLVRY